MARRLGATEAGSSPVTTPRTALRIREERWPVQGKSVRGESSGQGKNTPCPYQYLSAWGACGKPRAVSLDRQPKARSLGFGATK
jgi:hypothetical protein